MSNEILKSSDLKATKRRQEVLSILQKAEAPMTAEEIYVIAIKAVHMSLSTAYRTLATLSEKGIILKSQSQDGKAYYQINDHQHKHYLVCTLCGEVLPIDGCPLEALEKEIAKKTGYTITGHNLAFSGICPRCCCELNKRT